MVKKLLFILVIVISNQVAAQEVIYHVFQRSFFDSNNDGHGDLKGMQQKLDYLQALGVTSILMTPLYQSEFYHNYFATDFEKIDPEYGTIDEYLSLVKEVHKRRMKIYQDVEMQYVTHEHPWFKDSFGNPASRFSNYLYYLDSQNQKPFYFYHIPEFTTYDNLKQKIIVVNMNNPAVRQYTLHVLRYWTDPNGDGKFDDGVDGFRLDHMMDDLDNFKLVSNLFEKFWTPIIKDLKKKNPSLVITAEQANWFSLGLEYLENAEVDRVFSFRLWWAIETLNKKNIIEAADSSLLYNPEGKQQIVFIENHDTRRYASVKGMNPDRLKVGASLNILIGGIPSLYYGQELGMKGSQSKGKTDGNDIPVREAFEWSSNGEDKGTAWWYKNTGPWWDSTNIKPHDGISFEEQRNNPASLWNHYRKMIHLKKSTPALANGKYQSIANDNEQVLTFIRYTERETVLVVVNLADTLQRTSIDLSQKAKFKSASSLIEEKSTPLSKNTFTIHLKPYEVEVFKLR
jgi:alpha-amylase